MSGSNCWLLTCIQISQKTGKVVWYSSLWNFPPFVVIHTVKGFGVVNKTEVGVFLEHSSFFCDPTDVGNLISGPSAFSKSSLNTWKFLVYILLKLCLENFKVYLVNKLKLYLQNKQKARIGLRAIFYSLLVSMSLFKIHNVWK